MSRAGLIGSYRAPGEPYSTRAREGRGARLTLEDGREVIDAGTLSSCIAGHCHPTIVAAIQQAASTVYVSDNTGMELREQAVAALLERAFEGEDWAESVIPCVSASEATDLALLLAQLLTERTPLVARELSYHGALGLGRVVSTHPLWNNGLVHVAGGRVPPPPGAPLRTIPAPGCRDGAGAARGCDCEAGDPLPPGVTTALAGAAAVIADYGSGGVYPCAAHQDALARAARAAGALWICDETVTAMGRTGRMFAFQRGGERPDMVILGKVVTGGAAPGAALVLSADVVRQLAGVRWMTGSTFRGHPLSAAAIVATVDVVVGQRLHERARELGELLGPRLRELAAAHPLIEHVRGDGMVWSLSLAAPPQQHDERWAGEGMAATPAQALTAATLAHGAALGAYSGQIAWLVPPLVIEQQELDAALAALARGLEDCERKAA